MTYKSNYEPYVSLYPSIHPTFPNKTRPARVSTQSRGPPPPQNSSTPSAICIRTSSPSNSKSQRTKILGPPPRTSPATTKTSHTGPKSPPLHLQHHEHYPKVFPSARCAGTVNPQRHDLFLESAACSAAM
ncbi:hypothetical protein BDW74DRAFT_151712, partial [Aspergillus multicolor]|uniref:uncharacterized protein n=1 Tax=Aspergillus multicolor TaxID=41759 RepID=UPI003CCD7C51